MNNKRNIPTNYLTNLNRGDGKFMKKKEKRWENTFNCQHGQRELIVFNEFKNFLTNSEEWFRVPVAHINLCSHRKSNNAIIRY